MSQSQSPGCRCLPASWRRTRFRRRPCDNNTLMIYWPLHPVLLISAPSQGRLQSGLSVIMGGANITEQGRGRSFIK